MTRAPSWCVVVFRYDDAWQDPRQDAPSLGTRMDIAYFAHHALSNGMSGLAFHDTFHAHFQEALDGRLSDMPWPIRPGAIMPPIPLENAIGLAWPDAAWA